MTTIKSVFEHSPVTLVVERDKRRPEEAYFRVEMGGRPEGDAMVSYPEVLAALDAIPNTEVETLWEALEEAALGRNRLANARDECKARAEKAEAGRDELGCGCDEADENLKAAIKRAEEAEAEALEQAKLVRTWADRAEQAEANHETTKTAYRQLGASHAELLARAEKAEATIARVDDVLTNGEIVFGESVEAAFRDALDPKPAFVLPTEVPARIEARRDGKTYTFYLWTNGAGGSNDLIWVDEDDWTHSPSPERLMRDFTAHRLIGADEQAKMRGNANA